VYSPTKGMTSGGHLVMYNTLHLTEHIRSYDESTLPGTKEKQAQYATNNTHTIDRQLICMMLAMPDFVRVRGMSSSHRSTPFVSDTIMWCIEF
jgi:hypothetical protein